MEDFTVLFVCPKSGPWPPKSWGAVEIVVYELSTSLQAIGVKADVFPTNSLADLVSYIKKNLSYSILHLHYDDFHRWYWILKILFPSLRILATSHFAYLTQLDKQPFYRDTTFFHTYSAIQEGLEYYPLTPQIQSLFPKRLSVIPNGASLDIRFSEFPRFQTRTICLGKVEPRKGQHRLQTFSSIDFVGPLSSKTEIPRNYKGEWTRQDIYQNLTDYGCLILLSEAEAAPLVILEGLMAGCGIVCTSICLGNLPALPWIQTVSLTESSENIQQAISKVSSCSPEDRILRRKWAEQNISWNTIAQLYKKIVLNAS
jgi:glycosyltransferase involved in cell wall biosynthesis